MLRLALCQDKIKPHRAIEHSHIGSMYLGRISFLKKENKVIAMAMGKHEIAKKLMEVRSPSSLMKGIDWSTTPSIRTRRLLRAKTGPGPHREFE